MYDTNPDSYPPLGTKHMPVLPPAVEFPETNTPRAGESAAASEARTAAARAAYKDAATGATGATGHDANKPPRRLLSLLSSAERKKYPMAAGLLDYFPDALAMVSNVSYRGNEKHNPGQPTHWARGKSMDHADCIIRHMVERGSVDPEGIPHLAEAAWRALAILQEALEQEYNLDPPRGAK